MNLEAYIRHAERFGVSFVYEAAVKHLDATALESLSKRLKELDPSWTTPKIEKPEKGS